MGSTILNAVDVASVAGIWFCAEGKREQQEPDAGTGPDRERGTRARGVLSMRGTGTGLARRRAIASEGARPGNRDRVQKRRRDARN